ncbi:MAG: SDR family NAD(P)-dependent oxidoreductase [Acetivibrionales bacterium]
MRLPFKIDLKDKVAVVTGGGGVLCSTFAKALAHSAAQRLLVMNLTEEKAKQVAEEIVNEGGTAIGLTADVTRTGKHEGGACTLSMKSSDRATSSLTEQGEIT